MKYIPINFALFLQPLNWIIIVLMLTIAGFGIETVYHFVAGNAANNSTEEVR